MTETMLERRARLFTAFGTVLYIDPISRQLRHGPVESSPANLYFVAEPSFSTVSSRGRLMHESRGERTFVLCRSDRCYAIGRDGAGPAELQLTRLERGLIALRGGDCFLCAVPGGEVSLSASTCSTWELFLASESWCGAGAGDSDWRKDARFDVKSVKSYLIHPSIRAASKVDAKARKVLIYGYTKWSHGRVYYDVARRLHERGYVVDILDWQVGHWDYFEKLVSSYDFVMTALDGVRPLVEEYRLPFEKIIAISHSEFDIRMLVEAMGMEAFERFASYGVVGEFLYCASLTRGVKREPVIAQIGVDYDEFYSEPSERLEAVGYGSSIAVETFGVEWKRGNLAEAAAKRANLPFKVAGWTGEQTSFHDMPDFYRSVDAVLVSSLTESGPLPAIEAAAAGRLVIGAPVGHIPRKAYEGGAILAPIEQEKFVAFCAETLSYYRDRPGEYVKKCLDIRESAQNFDWRYCIDGWIDLIEAAA